MEGNFTNDGKMANQITSPAQTQNRVSLKPQSHFSYPIWKQKLRENCYRRVREDRTRLLWKMRLSKYQSPGDDEDFIKSAFQDIVYDEMKRIEDSSRDTSRNLASNPDSDDILWEYEGINDAYEGDSEEILLEMQRIFYEDLKSEETTKGSEDQIETWEDEEDEYLATKVFENMNLSDEQVLEQIWCPICKQGALLETHRQISCSACEMQLNKDNEVNLDILRERLAEAHADHLDRGCRLKPRFSIQTRFNLKALYMTCEACNSFEVIV